MPRCGTMFDESSPLLGGARAVRPWGGLWLLGKPTPAAFATAVASAATPPMEGSCGKFRINRKRGVRARRLQ